MPFPHCFIQHSTKGICNQVKKQRLLISAAIDCTGSTVVACRLVALRPLPRGAYSCSSKTVDAIYLRDIAETSFSDRLSSTHCLQSCLMAACVQKKTIFMCSSGIALCLQAASMHIETGCRCSRCRHGVPKKQLR